MQAGLLAVAVLAATTAGFVALREAFGENGRDVGESPALAANGEIVFSREGVDGRFHLYAVQPDGSGLRQVTRDATNDTDPTVSPGGETIAYVHELHQGIRVIATVPIDGGIVGWHTPEAMEASDPAWSSDGKSIAFVAWAKQSVPPGFEAPQRYRAIFSVDATNGRPERLTDGGIPFTSDPTWSPSDRSIAFAGGSCAVSCEDTIKSDLYIVEVSSTDVRQLTPSGELDKEAPGWSPEGTMIAFTRPGERGDEVWTVAPDGTDETLVATAVKASLEPDLAWAPDGSALLVSDGEWIYRVDPTPQSDPDANLVKLVRGHSPAWQPLPPGSDPMTTVSPEPSLSPSPSPVPEDGDIGLGFNVCNLAVLSGIDFLGDGAAGIAWVGNRVRDNGSCPSEVAPQAVVAADFNGDEIADSWWAGIEYCLYCMPWVATDLDADGDEELVILESSSSTPSYLVFTARVDPAGRPELRPVTVAPPGAEVARLPAGDPLRITTGGDEGFSGWVRCEGFPAAPVLVLTWRDHPIEGETMEVHETKLVLQQDGAAHIIETNDYSAPVGTPVRGVSDAPACGVDWQILG